jgi:branched-chain amino acid transport system substrate-binding protein
LAPLAPLAALCLALGFNPAWGFDNKVTLAVVTDMSGPYSVLTGEGEVVATKMAVDDCLKAECKGMQIDVMTADHQGRPDVALSIIRRWLDERHIDAFLDTSNATIQLGLNNLVRERNKVALFAGGSDVLTNEQCAPNNSVVWMYDTYAQVAGTVKPLAKPGTKWFIITADYAFGHSLEKNARKLITEQGGTVVGSVRHPFPTSDFSSFLLQAQVSRADYIVLANAGPDAQNAIKQAQEFNITKRQKLVAFVLLTPDVRSIGLKGAQGIVLTEGWYWDLNDRTRAWAKRYFDIYKKDMPAMTHAGYYSAVLHYLKAVAATKSTDATTVTTKMRETPVSDDVIQSGYLRKDGRMIHDYYLFRVKSPEESKGPYDVYQLLETVKGEDVFRPLSESTCPLIKR